MEKFNVDEINKLPNRKKLEMKWYKHFKWFYFKAYSLYGYYWGYKLIVKDYNLPYWEHWALWLFAMLSLYFFGREEKLDNFFKN